MSAIMLKEFIVNPQQKHLRLWNADYTSSVDVIADDWDHGTFTIPRIEALAQYLWDKILHCENVGALHVVDEWPRKPYAVMSVHLLKSRDRMRVVTERLEDFK